MREAGEIMPTAAPTAANTVVKCCQMLPNTIINAESNFRVKKGSSVALGLRMQQGGMEEDGM